MAGPRKKETHLTGKPCRKCSGTLRYARNGDCVECAIARSSKWHRATKQGPNAVEFQKNRNLQARVRQYKITVADLRKIMGRQMGLCAICRNNVASHIDHDHVTGDVRGVLCLTCNTALGSMRDSVDLLEAAIAYLNK